MAKKKLMLIEFRYDKADGWTEYCRTYVGSMVDHYYYNASIENPGAEVRIRPVV